MNRKVKREMIFLVVLTTLLPFQMVDRWKAYRNADQQYRTEYDAFDKKVNQALREPFLLAQRAKDPVGMLAQLKTLQANLTPYDFFVVSSTVRRPDYNGIIGRLGSLGGGSEFCEKN